MKKLTDSFTLINGVKVPCLGFGTYLTPADETKASVLSALSLGYRHIDTAKAYGNEAPVGEAVRESGIARSEIFVTTKHWITDRGYDKTVTAIDESLRTLGLDYIDLYLIHWPCVEKVSPNWAEINADTWRGFEAAYRAGKIRAIGVSNFERRHIDALNAVAEIKPMVNQLEFHPGYLQPDAVAYSKECGMLVQAFSPLALGAIFKDDTILALAKKYGKTPAQIALRFVLQSGINPLTKTVRAERMIENANIFDFALSAQDMAVIASLGEMGFTGWRPEDAPADALVQS